MSKDRPELLGMRAANSEADEAAAKTHPQKEVSSAAPPPAPESAKEFHKAHCGIAIPLYAVSAGSPADKREEILSKVYEFGEAYAAHLQAEPAYCLLGRLVVLACQFFEVLGNTYDARAVLNPVRGCVAVFRCIFGQRCTDRLVGIVDCCGPLRWHVAIDNSAIGIFHS